jgi:ubiquitin C
MEIFVQLRANEKVSTNVNPYDTLLQLKQKIEVMYNIPVAQQMLVFAGNPMIDDDKVLLDYRLEKFSTVYLVLKLRGGCNNADGICTCNKQKPST